MKWSPVLLALYDVIFVLWFCFFAWLLCFFILAPNKKVVKSVVSESKFCFLKASNRCLQYLHTYQAVRFFSFQNICHMSYFELKKFSTLISSIKFVNFHLSYTCIFWQIKTFCILETEFLNSKMTK